MAEPGSSSRASGARQQRRNENRLGSGLQSQRARSERLRAGTWGQYSKRSDSMNLGAPGLPASAEKSASGQTARGRCVGWLQQPGDRRSVETVGAGACGQETPEGRPGGVSSIAGSSGFVPPLWPSLNGGSHRHSCPIHSGGWRRSCSVPARSRPAARATNQSLASDASQAERSAASSREPG